MICIGGYAVTNAVYYYGTQYSMENIGKNFGFNMLIVGCLEFVAYFSSSKMVCYLAFFIDKVKRKRLMIIMSLVTSSTAVLFIIPAIGKSEIAQIILVPLGRFFASKAILT